VPVARRPTERFAGAGKRLRRIGIVALARRLAIALWRFLEHGEIPASAILKSREINIASI
jgi:transposase